MKSKETILFSGRFDGVHLSHFLTIRDLSREYDKVLVVVLDYPESYYPLSKRMHILETVFDNYSNIEIVSNTIHFGEIKEEDLGRFDFDVYGSGNEEVLKHIESLGWPCVYVPRTLETTASDDVKYHKIKKILEG